MRSAYFDCCGQVQEQCQQVILLSLPEHGMIPLVCLEQDENVPIGGMCPALQNQI